MKLSKKTKRYVLDAAKNVEIQKWILQAMFAGCEPGTDIFNHLCNGIQLPEDLQIKMFGSLMDDPEDDINFDQDCISVNPLAATELINAVEKELLKKI